MKRVAFCGLFAVCSLASGDDRPAPPEMRRIEANYERAVAVIEADAAKQIAVLDADRIEAYKTIVERLSKAGDVDKALTAQNRLRECEDAARSDRGPVGSRLSILSATYGVNQSWFDVTDKLRRMVGSAKNWTAQVKDDDFGDPAPNYHEGNTLIVRYSVRGKVGMRAVYEGRIIAIP